MHEKLACFLWKIQTYGNYERECEIWKPPHPSLTPPLPYIQIPIKHNALKISHSLSQEFASYIPIKFLYFIKNRLIFNIFYFFLYVCKQTFCEHSEREIFWVLFLHKHEHIKKFSNPH